jgi:hypothetical protein
MAIPKYKILYCICTFVHQILYNACPHPFKKRQQFLKASIIT